MIERTDKASPLWERHLKLSRSLFGRLILDIHREKDFPPTVWLRARLRSCG